MKLKPSRSACEPIKESDEQNISQRIRELFETDELNRIYERAAREALLMHKRAGNPVAVERDGKLVILQPDEINVESE